MNKSRKKLFKRIIWTLSLLLAFIVISGLTLAYVYEAEVKQFAIAKINEHTKSKIKVEKIELSFLKRFPMAALQFHNVEIMEAVKAGEPGILLKANDIYLKFNVIDLMQRKLVIKDVEINQSKLNLVVFEDGSDNFHIFKPSKKAESNMILELFKVTLTDAVVLYHNFASKQDLDLLIQKMQFAGNFDEKKFKVNLEGENIIRSYSSEGYKMFKNKELDLNIDVAINPTSKQFEIKKGNIIYNKIPFNISGNITIPEAGVLLDLHLDAPSISLTQLMETVPPTYKSRFADYQIHGLIGITASVKGLVVSRSVPLIKVAVELKNGEIKNTNFDTKLQNINLQANYTNGKNHALSSSSIQIKSLNFNLGFSSFQIKLILNNFVNAHLKMELNSQLDLGELIRFTGKLYGIQKMSGKADLNIKTVGNIAGLVGNKKLNIEGLNYTSRLDMKGSNFKHQSSGVYYQNIEGSLSIDANKIVIDPTWLDINGHRQQLSGSVTNYIDWAEDPVHNKLLIQAKAKISHLAFKDIQQMLTNNSESDGTFPNDIDMTLHFEADTFVWKNRIARNAQGVFSLRNQIISVENTKFEAFGGQFVTTTSINGTQASAHPIVSQGTLNNVDINQLFHDFNSFDQQIITDKNIKGRLSAQYIFKASYDANWSLNSKTMVLESDITIDQGELINIKELNALSKYTRIDDFSHIKFSKLENSIQIIDRKIKIPDMKIISNKMNLDLTGTHDFDNVYDYHIGVLMSDVLFKKAKAKSPNEFGEVQSDGYGRTKLFFHVFGSGDDMHVKYDRVSLAKKMKKDIKNDGEELKSTLNNEFGWFKESQKAAEEDSVKTAKEKKKNQEKENLKKQEEGEFIFEWDEEEEEPNEPPQGI